MKILSFLTITSLFGLFLLFLKIGLVFFGGGYAILPLLHRELVSNLHFLTERQFIDGVAISQLTPGPVAIFATFAGYCISGGKGALIATFAMFLPGIAVMIFLSKIYKKIKNSDMAIKTLNTINPIIIGLLLVTSFKIGKASIDNLALFIEFILTFLLLIKFKPNPAILVLISALIGLFFKF